MTTKTKFKYKLTGRYGTNLYEALRERDFNDYEACEAEYILEATKIGGDRRENFISWLESTLSFSKWADYSQKAGVPCEKLNEWLMANELPSDEGELELREQYAREEASNVAYDAGTMCQDDDIETAYTFGLIKETDLPQDVRCERRILVSGFYCNIHDGNAEYKEPVPRLEVLTCPSCGHPICPVCADCYEKDPKTIDEAREYVASCDSVSGHAYCGNCGDYSVEFMLRFLRLIGCPIPPECEDFVQPKREARFCMTATVDALPNKDSILRTAITEFNKGTTGIIKIQDATGEIWAYPERHPEGWLVTLLYPEER